MAEDLYNPFTPYHFMRYDESDDSLFYQEPRLVVHIDDQAIAVTGELFQEVFSAPGAPRGPTREEGEPVASGGKVIMDLMSKLEVPLAQGAHESPSRGSWPQCRGDEGKP